MTLKNELGRLRYWWGALTDSTKYNVRVGALTLSVVSVLGGCGTWVYQAFIDTDPQSATVASRDWERQIEIEMFKTVQERDWRGQEPDDARVYDERREVHHTDSYECGGYETNSEGEWVYESDTCYRDVYQTRLYYEVDRWREHRWIVSHGVELAPAWPPLPDTLDGSAVLGHERRGDETRERYTIHVRCGECDDGSKVNVSLAEWDDFTVNREVIALVTARGIVKDIKVPAQGT